MNKETLPGIVSFQSKIGNIFHCQKNDTYENFVKSCMLNNYEINTVWDKKTDMDWSVGMEVYYMHDGKPIYFTIGRLEYDIFGGNWVAHSVLGDDEWSALCRLKKKTKGIELIEVLPAKSKDPAARVYSEKEMIKFVYFLNEQDYRHYPGNVRFIQSRNENEWNVKTYPEIFSEFETYLSKQPK